MRKPHRQLTFIDSGGSHSPTPWYAVSTCRLFCYSNSGWRDTLQEISRSRNVCPGHSIMKDGVWHNSPTSILDAADWPTHTPRHRSEHLTFVTSHGCVFAAAREHGLLLVKTRGGGAAIAFVFGQEIFWVEHQPRDYEILRQEYTHSRSMATPPSGLCFKLLTTTPI